MIHFVTLALGIFIGYLGYPLISWYVEWAIPCWFRQAWWRVEQTYDNIQHWLWDFATDWIHPVWRQIKVCVLRAWQWYKNFARDFYVLWESVRDFDWAGFIQWLQPVHHTSYFRLSNGDRMVSTWLMWFGRVLGLKTVKAAEEDSE